MSLAPTVDWLDAKPASRSAAAAAPQIRLWYRTGWERAYVHGSVCSGAWQDYELQRQPGLGLERWVTGVIPLPDQANGGAPAILDFVITDKNGTWDKPAAGGNYRLEAPGVYSVRGGRVQLLTGPAVLLVSDLDGTMVGDDAATAAFRSWWEDVGVLRGGQLVYNTGRSLASFEGLLNEKAHCLATPHTLVTAVGTKIYARSSGGRWVLDDAWMAELDAGWNLQAAREACYQQVAQVGSEAMHFRPPEEQNEHKVTCGVRDDVSKKVVDALTQALQASGVQANVIFSGHGGWKYVDVVPARAGKLQALEHVRRAAGFSLAATVACGDSGNDILMLSGDNLALVVGNAQPDLRSWAQAHAGQEGPAALGKSRLHMASRHEAYGILEGLEYWGLK